MSERAADKVTAVTFTADTVYLTLGDGRVIGNPLAWHPWLAQATEEARSHVELYELAAFWPDLDDGLDAAEMMKGEPPRMTALRIESQS